MPARRDPEEARAAVTDVTARVLAADGLDGLTIRRVAQEAGLSTSFVTHYFSNKRDLVLATFRAQVGLARNRITHAIETGGSGDLLLDVAGALLPTTRERLQECRVWFAYHSLAVGDAELIREWRRMVDAHEHRLTELIVAEQRAGTIHADIDAGLAATRLLALVDGIIYRAVLQPAAVPRDRQLALVAGHIALLRRT